MMKFFARMVGCAAMAMVLCAVLFSFAGGWFGKEGSALQFARDTVLAWRCSEILRHRHEVVYPTLEAKQRIIADLVDGRFRLCEAIDQFQRLNKGMNEELAIEDVEQGMVGTWVPSPTDPESAGRAVLAWVRAEVDTWPPDKAERLLADLESEFRELFGGAPLTDSSTDFELTRPDMVWNSEPRTVQVNLAERLSNKRYLGKNAD